MKHAKPRKPRPLPAIADEASALRHDPEWRPMPRNGGGMVYTGAVEVESEADPNHRAARVPSWSSSTVPSEVLTPEARAARASQWVLLARGSGRFA